DGGTHDHLTILGTRHRTLNQQQLTLGVNACDLEILNRGSDVTEVTSHALTRKHTTRILRHANRPRHIVRTGVTMSSTTGTKVVALDRAGVTLTDRHALHVHLLTGLEHRNGNGVA